MSVIKSYWHYNLLSLWYKLLICMPAMGQLGCSQNHLSALKELHGQLPPFAAFILSVTWCIPPQEAWIQTRRQRGAEQKALASHIDHNTTAAADNVLITFVLLPLREKNVTPFFINRYQSCS